MPANTQPATTAPTTPAKTIALKLPVPVTVLTGYLGSGKTTLLKQLLANPDMAGTAVIINEFGDAGLDHDLVEKAEEDTVLLPSGCVCCQVRGDLIKALADLHDKVLRGKIPPLARVVLETSGLADPTPIVHTMMTDEEVYRVYQLDGVVTTLDALHGLKQLDAEYEPAKQIALADRIILTKTDLVPTLTVSAVWARARELNRSAGILTAVKGNVSLTQLFGLGAHEPAISGTDAERWLAADGVSKHGHDHTCGPDCGHEHGHHDHAQPVDHTHADHTCGPDCTHDSHDHAHHAHAPAQQTHLHGVASFSLEFTRALNWNAFRLAMETLTAAYGEKLLRIKGILDIEGEKRPIVVHAVQHVFYPPDKLEGWPTAAAGQPSSKRSRLVFITKDLPRETIEKHIAPFLNDVR